MKMETNLMQVTRFERLADPKTATIETVEAELQRIEDGDLFDQVYKLRGETDPDKREYIKNRLPGVCFGGTFSVRSKAGFIAGSGLAILDFDKVGHTGYFKDALSADPYIFATWISPSGNGVKALVRIPEVTTPAQYSGYFRGLQKYFAPFNPDKGSDITRFCFTSHDPDIYRNPNSSVWRETIRETDLQKYDSGIIRKFHATPDQVRSYDTARRDYTTFDTQLGKRHDFRVRLTARLNELGVTRDNAINWILRDYPTDNPEKAAKDIIDIYRRKAPFFGSKPLVFRDGKRFVPLTKEGRKYDFTGAAVPDFMLGRMLESVYGTKETLKMLLPFPIIAGASSEFRGDAIFLHSGPAGVCGGQILCAHAEHEMKAGQYIAIPIRSTIRGKATTHDGLKAYFYDGCDTYYPYLQNITPENEDGAIFVVNDYPSAILGAYHYPGNRWAVIGSIKDFCVEGFGHFPRHTKFVLLPPAGKFNRWDIQARKLRHLFNVVTSDELQKNGELTLFLHLIKKHK